MSSAENKFISNEEAVPVIDCDIFSSHEDSRFALGVLRPNDVMSYKPESLAQAYLRLRANVYVDQTGMLTNPEVKRLDGTELDKDDERSTHFIVVENRLGKAAVFACGRMIEKTDMDDPLPIETFFPDAFTFPASLKTTEVSRFISRHDEPRHSMIAKKELMTAGLAHSLTNNLGPVLAVVEPKFERDLRLMRVPVKNIAQPRMVMEYNDENLGIEIDMIKLQQRLGEEAVKKMTVPVGSYVYWGQIQQEVLA